MAAVPAGIPSAGAAPADGAGSLTVLLLADPQHPPASARERAYVVASVRPGERVVRRIKVSDDSSRRLPVALYPGPATIADGQIHFSDRGATNDLTSWTSVTPTTTYLAAGANTTATVTITVPADAKAGERYAVLWAETQSAAASNAPITQVNRVGVRIYLNVTSDGTVATPDFEIGPLTAHSDSGRQSAEVTAQVHNTGSVAIDLSGQVSLSDGPGQARAGPFATTQAVTIGPGQTAPVTVPVHAGLSVGPWTARLTLTSGSTTHSRDGTVSFGVTPADAHRASSSWWRWLVGIGIAVILAAIGWLVLVVRRRRRHEPPEA
jgi:hypothetical protein